MLNTWRKNIMSKNIMTLETLEHFRNQLIHDEKSKATIEKYMRDVLKFYRYLNENPITKERIIEYKQNLIQSYEPSSVNSMLASINAYLKIMELSNYTVKTLKIQHQTFRDPRRELTKEEYFRLLKTAKSNKNTRLYLIMQTICSTGIRVGELPFITVEALAMGKTKVHFKGKTRIILLPKELCKELKQYVKCKKIQSGSIFITRNGKNVDRSNILHEMKALCSQANVSKEKVFPHNLRHLFACLYYKSVRDLSRLADILGHSNVNTTRIYTSVSGNEQLRQIEQLGLVWPYKMRQTT